MKKNKVWSIALSLTLLLCSSPQLALAADGVQELSGDGNGLTDTGSGTSTGIQEQAEGDQQRGTAKHLP